MTELRKRIVVVGQTPPPFGGQAVMIENLLRGKYKNITCYHVRMAFSKEMDEIGKIKIFKFFHLLKVTFRILYVKFRYRIDTLYFPPSGPNRIPFYRDAFILCLTRPFFNKTLFHFHASGISELYPQLGFFSRILFRRAYFNADVGIRLSKHSPGDVEKLNAKKEFIIPYGIDDSFLKFQNKKKAAETRTILFVGVIMESKGPLILIDAASILKRKGIAFRIELVGKFESLGFEKKIKQRVIQHSLENHVHFLGVLTGDRKFEAYSNADIFCFPSYFEAESFPVVLLEALSFKLPIVSSLWRGIPSIVEHGINGYLCEVKDVDDVAEKLQWLIQDVELSESMGSAGRQRFLNNYTLEKFYQNIESAFIS